MIFIIGAIFAGFSIAKALANAQVEVAFVDWQNRYLFQPLLNQFATSVLIPAHLAFHSIAFCAASTL